MTSQPKPCWNNCGAMIYFEDGVVGKNGKAVPIDQDTNLPHECPNSPFNKNKRDNSFIGSQVLDQENRDAERNRSNLL